VKNDNICTYFVLSFMLSFLGCYHLCYHLMLSFFMVSKWYHFYVIIFPGTYFVLSFMLSFDVNIYCYNFPPFFFFLQTWHTRLKASLKGQFHKVLHGSVSPKPLKSLGVKEFAVESTFIVERYKSTDRKSCKPFKGTATMTYTRWQTRPSQKDLGSMVYPPNNKSLGAPGRVRLQKPCFAPVRILLQELVLHLDVYAYKSPFCTCTWLPTKACFAPVSVCLQELCAAPGCVCLQEPT
jgi:hypothetical protein